MSTRTAVIVIDNFLPPDKWKWIKQNISEFLHTETFVENKDEPHVTGLTWIKERLVELDIFQDHWHDLLDKWSFVNTLPSNINREASGTGYHIDFGGFVYYIHPSWDSSWGGHLLLQNCDVAKVEPKPNRFVWINPKIPHGIEVVNSKASHNRITIVGWPEGCIEDCPGASSKINTTY